MLRNNCDIISNLRYILKNKFTILFNSISLIVLYFCIIFIKCFSNINVNIKIDLKVFTDLGSLYMP